MYDAATLTRLVAAAGLEVESERHGIGWGSPLYPRFPIKQVRQSARELRNQPVGRQTSRLVPQAIPCRSVSTVRPAASMTRVRLAESYMRLRPLATAVK